MGDLLVGALSVLLATNQPAALTNLVEARTGIPLAAAPDRDPRMAELRRVMEQDDEARAEVTGWVKAARPGPGDAPSPEAAQALQARINARLAKVVGAYEDLIRRHPDYAPARNAYATFLEETDDEEGAIVQLEKARDIDPKDAAVWNNLGNHYGHIGPIEKAFPAYERAVELNPFEPVYRYNLATVVFLFRKDAQAYYHVDEQAVFDKALGMYREVRRLRPDNFHYAFDFAQTYYGVKLPATRTPGEKHAAEVKMADTAIAAWDEALALADNDVDREGILLHRARWHLRAGRWDAARTNLVAVTNEVHQATRRRIERNLAAQSSTNAPAGSPAGAE